LKLQRTKKYSVRNSICNCIVGASIFVYDHLKFDVLGLAFRYGSLNMVRSLLQLGANLDISTAPKFDAILISALTPCRHGWTDSTSNAKVNEEIELLDLLIEARANLAAEVGSKSVLMSCVTDGCRPRLEYLINAGVPCCTVCLMSYLSCVVKLLLKFSWV
jgi:ankyrin repeat protein